jgi:hypothetical protein
VGVVYRRYVVDWDRPRNQENAQAGKRVEKNWKKARAGIHILSWNEEEKRTPDVRKTA